MLMCVTILNMHSTLLNRPVEAAMVSTLVGDGKGDQGIP